MKRSGWKLAILAGLCAAPAVADAGARGGAATRVPVADLKWTEFPASTG
jgi:hypothetical protein